MLGFLRDLAGTAISSKDKATANDTLWLSFERRDTSITDSSNFPQ
jgi:hypothetical protein